jgi:hypothetical protein
MNLFRVPVLIVVIVLITGSSCQHPEGYGTKPGVGYFWRNADPDVEYTLYVNGENKGILPYLVDSVSKGKNAGAKQGLALTLSPGKYSILARYPDGQHACEGTLTLKIIPGSTNIASSWNNNKCSVRMEYED